MKRRTFLASGVGVALSVPSFKTVEWMAERDRILNVAGFLLDNFGAAPAMASEIKPGDEAAILRPVQLAYLAMLGYAEGTFIPGVKDYDPFRVLVGSTPSNPKMITVDGKEWSKHPGFRSWEGNSKSKYKSLYTPGDMNVPGYPLRFSGDLSDAAGAYQFISTTWQGVRHDRGLAFREDLGDFAPENQTLAAMYLTAGNGRSFGTGGHWWLRSAIEKRGDHIWIDHNKWLQAVRCDSREWASLKGANIGAKTGQSTKEDWWLWSRFVYSLWDKTGKTKHIPHSTTGKLTSPFGWRVHPVKNGWRFHNGIDVADAMGTPIYAPEDGSVTANSSGGGYGNFMKFVPDRDPTIELFWGHNQKNLVAANTWVPKGTHIANMGSTGMSTGPHIHFEVTAFGHRIDPAFYWNLADWFLPE